MPQSLTLWVFFSTFLGPGNFSEDRQFDFAAVQEVVIGVRCKACMIMKPANPFYRICRSILLFESS